jgi:uncharacterized protein YrrD
MLRSLNDLEQYEMGATDGDIGRVVDFYFDDDSWVIRYLVVETGNWLSSRKVLISPMAVQGTDWNHQRLPLMLTKEQIKNAPSIDTEKPVSRQTETEFLSYYGYPYYWGGGGLWGSELFPYALSPGYSGISEDPVERAAVNREISNRVWADQKNDDPHLRSCKALIGHHIHATNGEIGHVSTLLVDEKSWAIRYMVVDTSNWWMGHRVLVAPQWITDISWADESVTVNLTRERIQTAKDFDSTGELNTERETALYRHHQQQSYW